MDRRNLHIIYLTNLYHKEIINFGMRVSLKYLISDFANLNFVGNNFRHLPCYKIPPSMWSSWGLCVRMWCYTNASFNQCVSDSEPSHTSLREPLRKKQRIKAVNPFSANFTKWSNTLKQFVGNLPTNCLSVFDHFIGLALKGLINFVKIPLLYIWLGSECVSEYKY